MSIGLPIYKLNAVFCEFTSSSRYCKSEPPAIKLVQVPPDVPPNKKNLNPILSTSFVPSAFEYIFISHIPGGNML